jgi:hypothetical protein
MAEQKVFDADLVENLGKRIDGAVNDAIPEMASLTNEGQSLMTGAGQAGGILVVIGFLVASEYVEQACATKLEEAEEFRLALRKAADNMRHTEELHSR